MPTFILLAGTPEAGTVHRTLIDDSEPAPHRAAQLRAFVTATGTHQLTSEQVDALIAGPDHSGFEVARATSGIGYLDTAPEFIIHHIASLLGEADVIPASFVSDPLVRECLTICFASHTDWNEPRESGRRAASAIVTALQDLRDDDLARWDERQEALVTASIAGAIAVAATSASLHYREA